MGKRALDCEAPKLDVNSGSKSCGLTGKDNELTVGGLYDRAETNRANWRSKAVIQESAEAIVP